MATAEDVLAAARGEIGYSRYTDPEQGTKYGRWYAQLTGESYYGESGVPYCAMFASWCLAQAGAEAPGMPSAYCPYIDEAGQKAGRTPYNEDAAAGDLVLFDWGRDGVADHVGIVESNDPASRVLTTIEGNTSSGSRGSQSNGGGVYRRRRSYDSVCRIVRPYYGGGAQAQPTASALEVDGYWGSATTRRAQELAGLAADGEVWHQWPANKACLPGCTTGWMYDDTGNGSPLIAWMQRNVLNIDADGLAGPDFANAMIRTYGNGVQDGRLDEGSPAIMGFQRSLNDGHF